MSGHAHRFHSGIPALCARPYGDCDCVCMRKLLSHIIVFVLISEMDPNALKYRFKVLFTPAIVVLAGPLAR